MNTIIPYDPCYDYDIHMMEDLIVQGKSFQMKIIKKHFLDRAKVFNKFKGFLALNEEGLIIGTSICAKTSIIINQSQMDTVVGFDLKVHPFYRNQGIAGRLTKYSLDHFMIPEGLDKKITTLKKTNFQVVKFIKKLVGDVWLYDFVYLTIPVNSIIKVSKPKNSNKQLFTVGLFDKEVIKPYFTSVNEGLGYFHTYKMYKLKIDKIGYLYKRALSVLKVIQPKRFANLPKEGEMIQFATLYNQNANNIHHINIVLEQLRNTGIDFLMVCCRKNDCIYKTLKKVSINTYGYYIMTDFPITQTDEIAIDVRCL